MQVSVELPTAFSVRDENEFLPIQHLVAKMNPEFCVARVATGVHVNGGSTVLWGLVHMKGETLSKKVVEVALREAGFDFGHNVLIQASELWNNLESK